MMWGYGYEWMWLFGPLMLIGVALVVLAIVWAVTGRRWSQPRELGPGASGAAAKPTPRQILDERYARGELTTEEYHERMKVLSEGR
jgi:putative membrane protein